MAHVVNPFRQLLNHISHELSRQNLRSLLHICAPYVPENRREDIHCGLDLFECLIHWNVIGEDLDQMRNLLDFMRKMRPKRKDIIRTVKQYIQHHHPPPWDIESSGETYCSVATGHSHSVIVHQPYVGSSQHTINRSDSRASTPLLLSTSGNDQYSWCCICFDCKCVARRVPNCFLVAASVICLFLLIFACIVWYGKMPSSWHKVCAQAPAVGGGIVAILACLGVVFMVWYISRRVSEARQSRQSPIHHCSSGEFPNSSVTSGSVRSIPSVNCKRYKKRRHSLVSDANVGSAITNDSHLPSPPMPTRTNLPPITSNQMSYPDGCHENLLTEEEGTSGGDYTASGEESEAPQLLL